MTARVMGMVGKHRIVDFIPSPDMNSYGKFNFKMLHCKKAHGRQAILTAAVSRVDVRDLKGKAVRVAASRVPKKTSLFRTTFLDFGGAMQWATESGGRRIRLGAG